MSNLGAQAARAKRVATTQEGPAAVEARWRGHVQILGPDGTRWARVSMPESVMRQYLVGPIEPPNMRGIVIARIETELGSDQFVDGRWPERNL